MFRHPIKRCDQFTLPGPALELVYLSSERLLVSLAKPDMIRIDHIAEKVNALFNREDPIIRFHLQSDRFNALMDGVTGKP